LPRAHLSMTNETQKAQIWFAGPKFASKCTDPRFRIRRFLQTRRPPKWSLLSPLGSTTTNMQTGVMPTTTPRTPGKHHWQLKKSKFWWKSVDSGTARDGTAPSRTTRRANRTSSNQSIRWKISPKSTTTTTSQINNSRKGDFINDLTHWNVPFWSVVTVSLFCLIVREQKKCLRCVFKGSILQS